MTRRVPDLMVERLAAGELQGADADALRARLEAEEGGVERLTALQADNEAVLAAMPPRVFAAAVEARAAAERPSRSLMWAGIPVLAAAVALVVAVPVLAPAPGPDGEIVRAKGDPALQVHRLGDDAPLEPGEAARAGDLLQVSYTASGASYGAILSVDGRGTVTWHLPERGRKAARLQPGGGVPLGQSYELDDAPAYERFLFVTASHPFDLGPVEQEVRGWASGDLRDLALDPSLRTTLFVVTKEGRR